MDKEEIEKGKKAALAKLTDGDRDFIKDLNKVEMATGWVNYTATDHGAPRGPMTQAEREAKEKEDEEKDKLEGDDGDDDDDDLEDGEVDMEDDPKDPDDADNEKDGPEGPGGPGGNPDADKAVGGGNGDDGAEKSPKEWKADVERQEAAEKDKGGNPGDEEAGARRKNPPKEADNGADPRGSRHPSLAGASGSAHKRGSGKMHCSHGICGAHFRPRPKRKAKKRRRHGKKSSGGAVVVKKKHGAHAQTSLSTLSTFANPDDQEKAKNLVEDKNL